MSPTRNPIDLTIADLMARGSSQKRWLQQMLSPTGLDPTDGKYGRYSRALWRRIDAFVGNLSQAGYTTLELPLGPRGQGRIVITSFVPAAVPLLAAIRANANGAPWGSYLRGSHFELLEWAEQAGPEVLGAAASIAQWFTGSLEDLLAVAPGIAQGPALSATPEWRR